jgi:hypothetical protein
MTEASVPLISSILRSIRRQKTLSLLQRQQRSKPQTLLVFPMDPA